MKVLFTVRRVYFDQIVAGTKTEEIRKAVPRWVTVAQHLARDDREGRLNRAIFMCGPRLHYREIVGVEVMAEGAASVLGRPLSEQGQLDVGQGPVVVFHLGDSLPSPVVPERGRE
jgi:hypothetical protein